MKSKKRRELIEWLILIVVFGTLYFTGWHKPLISKIQGLVLETGIISPSIEKNQESMNYDFNLITTENKIVNLNTYQNKVLFINLWATWCPPCIAEMPDIHDLYLKKGDQVEFVMISLDQNESKAREFIEKKGYTFPVFFPSDGLPDVIRSQSIPTTFVVNKEGQIVVRNEGMAKYDSEKFRGLLDSLL